MLFFLPHISFAAVSLPVYDLRAHPVGGASDGLDSSTRHADGLDTFAGSKVSQLHVPWWVSQDVRTWWNENKKWAQSYSRVSRGLVNILEGIYFDSEAARLMRSAVARSARQNLNWPSNLRRGEGKLFRWDDGTLADIFIETSKHTFYSTNH